MCFKPERALALEQVDFKCNFKKNTATVGKKKGKKSVCLKIVNCLKINIGSTHSHVSTTNSNKVKNNKSCQRHSFLYIGNVRCSLAVMFTCNFVRFIQMKLSKFKGDIS